MFINDIINMLDLYTYNCILYTHTIGYAILVKAYTLFPLCENKYKSLAALSWSCTFFGASLKYGMHFFYLEEIFYVLQQKICYTNK